jgi:hypothetical protein
MMNTVVGILLSSYMNSVILHAIFYANMTENQRCLLIQLKVVAQPYRQTFPPSILPIKLGVVSEKPH